MTTIEFIKICRQLLDLTNSLVGGPNKKESQFQKVLEGITRRNYFNLYSIEYLAQDKNTGDAMLDLARSMLEDMISVEFMKLKGPEKMAKKFVSYASVEQKLDLDFANKLGGKLDESLVTEALDQFDKVKRNFMFRKDEIARSWSMTKFEDMVHEILKSGKAKDWEKYVILQAYTMGNRKNHLSPTDVITYMNQEFRNISLEHSYRVGLVIANGSYTKIAGEFSAQIGKNKMAKELAQIWKTLNSTKVE